MASGVAGSTGAGGIAAISVGDCNGIVVKSNATAGVATVPLKVASVPSSYVMTALSIIVLFS